MTFSDLAKIIELNHIPKDVKLLSNSGWECGPTDMDGVYYFPDKNELHFTQDTKSDYENGRMGNCRWIDARTAIPRRIETNVPQSPLDMRYIPSEFMSVGLCPNCWAEVSNGIGCAQHQCPSCGLPLKW